MAIADAWQSEPAELVLLMRWLPAALCRTLDTFAAQDAGVTTFKQVEAASDTVLDGRSLWARAHFGKSHPALVHISLPLLRLSTPSTSSTAPGRRGHALNSPTNLSQADSEEFQGFTHRVYTRLSDDFGSASMKLPKASTSALRSTQSRARRAPLPERTVSSARGFASSSCRCGDYALTISHLGVKPDAKVLVQGTGKAVRHHLALFG